MGQPWSRCVEMEVEKAATFQIGKGVRIKTRGDKRRVRWQEEGFLDESAVEGSQSAGGQIWLGPIRISEGGKAVVKVQKSHEKMTTGSSQKTGNEEKSTKS